MIELQGLKLNMYVVPGIIPIDTNGLIDWDILKKYGGSINASKKCIKLTEAIIPFSDKKHFEIPARSRMIFYAYTNDKNIF
jgi:hypothetical protein